MEPPSMKKQNQQNPVLVLKPPPPPLKHFPNKFISKNFNLLKAYESPLPLDKFLKQQQSSPIRAVLCCVESPVTLDVLNLLPCLRLVVTASAGVNHIDLDECRRRGIAVANAGNVFSDDGADAAVGLLIAVWRKIVVGDGFVRGGGVAKNNLVGGDFALGNKLRGKRIGIVGLGKMGTEVAKRLHAFGCIISYNSRKEKPAPYQFYSNLLQLATNSDALIICCGLTDQTHHMINRQVLSALGENGVIINVGRGAIIDEKELVRCLVNGEIGGAGLDVFENEPHVPRELFDLDNVVLTPHNSVFTDEALLDLCDVVVGNLEGFFAGRMLVSPVPNCY